MNEEQEKQTDEVVNRHFLFHKELLEVLAMMEALQSYDCGDNDEKVAQLERDIIIGIDRIRRYPEFYKEYDGMPKEGTDYSQINLMEH